VGGLRAQVKKYNLFTSKEKEKKAKLGLKKKQILKRERRMNKRPVGRNIMCLSIDY
jgi:hypothetical protein